MNRYISQFMNKTCAEFAPLASPYPCYILLPPDICHRKLTWVTCTNPISCPPGARGFRQREALVADWDWSENEVTMLISQAPSRLLTMDWLYLSVESFSSGKTAFSLQLPFLGPSICSLPLLLEALGSTVPPFC